jgi:hypothetical protein
MEETTIAVEEIDFQRPKDHEHKVRIAIQNVEGWKE